MGKKSRRRRNRTKSKAGGRTKAKANIPIGSDQPIGAIYQKIVSFKGNEQYQNYILSSARKERVARYVQRNEGFALEAERSKRIVNEVQQQRKLVKMSEIDFDNCAVCQIDLPEETPLKMFSEHQSFLPCCGKILCSFCMIFLKAAMKSPENAKLVKKRSKILAVAGKTCKCPFCNSIINSGDKAVESCYALAAAGFTPAQHYLADKPGDSSHRLYWLNMAAIEGSSRAHVDLAGYYLDGIIVPKSFEKARLHYESASPHCAKAIFEMGLMLKQGVEVAQDIQRAEHYFRVNAEDMYPPGVLQLSYILLDQGRIQEAKGILSRIATKESWRCSFSYEIAGAQFLLGLTLWRLINWLNIDRLIALQMVFWFRRGVRNGIVPPDSFHLECQGRIISTCGHCGISVTAPNTEICGCGVVAYCSQRCQRKHWKEQHKTECKLLRQKARELEASIEQACQFCCKENPKYLCSRCKEAFYCDKICQKLHWNIMYGHKSQCFDLD